MKNWNPSVQSDKAIDTVQVYAFPFLAANPEIWSCKTPECSSLYHGSRVSRLATYHFLQILKLPSFTVPILSLKTLGLKSFSPKDGENSKECLGSLNPLKSTWAL